jgi:hypothetical protein
MIFPTNKPLVLSATAVALRTVTVTAVPSAVVPNLDITGQPITPNLTISDATKLDGSGSVICTVPLASIVLGMVVRCPVTTSNGLAITSVPPGCSVSVDFG